jgi:hypothetical protein
MKLRLVLVLMFAALSLFTGSAQLAYAQADDVGIPQKLELTAAQRNAIYAAVTKDKSKISPQQFSPAVGAAVPPMIELYALPEEAIAADPAAEFFKYTMVENEVVLVDPTKMRVIDRIGPAPRP